MDNLCCAAGSVGVGHGQFLYPRGVHSHSPRHRGSGCRHPHHSGTQAGLVRRYTVRYIKQAALWGILIISGQGLRAADVPASFAVTSDSRPTNNTYRQDFETPKEKMGEITGTIKSLDRVSGKISVQDAKGITMEVSVETNT